MNACENALSILKDYFNSITSSKMRYYGEPWDTWDNCSTGIKGPCIYFLYKDNNDHKPIYIGETINLGKRLNEHKNVKDWGNTWNYVRYINEPLLENGQFRQLFECFCIYLLEPDDNNERRSNKV